MERNVDLKDITDGKRYGRNDLVKVGCNDCEGCSACCHGMGTSIVLDPYDVYRFTSQLNQSFEQLLSKHVELNVVDGVILPNLKMANEKDACTFLDENGRCSIHAHRPGICRIFPLGRIYENDSFDYILQVHECKKENKTKVKVQKWIDTIDIKENEAFIITWHYFIKDLQSKIKACKDDETIRTVNMIVLNLFYIKPYDASISFYPQFEERLMQAKEILKTIF